MKKAAMAFVFASILALSAGCAGDGARPGGNDGSQAIDGQAATAGEMDEQAAPPGERIESFYFYYPSGDSPDTNYEIARKEDGFVLLVDSIWNDDRQIGIGGKRLDELQAIIDEHDIAGWDGFDETSSETDTANSRFFLEIVYDGQKTIKARGDHAFPAGYDEAEEALLGFFEDIIETEHRLAAQERKKASMADVRNIESLRFSYWDNPYEVIPTYEISSTEKGLVLAMSATGYVLDVPAALLSKSKEKRILNILKKHDVFSLDGQERIGDGTEYISLFGTFIDSKGESFFFDVAGRGANVEELDAFRDELTKYLNRLLGFKGKPDREALATRKPEHSPD